MPRKALSRSSLVAALTLFAVLGRPLYGQSAFPAGAPGAGFQGFNTAGTASGGTGTTIPGTGNPFIRRGFPRATLMAPQGAVPINYDAALTPVAFEQPLDSPANPLSPTMPTGAAAAQQNNPVPPNLLAQPNNVTPPTPSVLPNYADGPAPGTPPGVLIPEAAVPMPTASGSADPVPAAGQPNLQGVALLRSVAQGPPAAGHPLLPILQWCEGALAQMEGLADYTCTFKKREFINGKMNEQCSMYVKSRPRPLSVYMHFLAPRDVHGQEAIYVAGQNGGRLLAHPVGIKQTLVGTVNLAPTDPQAMDGNRHPITDFGLRRLCERYREGLQEDLQFGECDVRIMDNVVVEGRPCVCIQISHPVPRQDFKFNVTRLYVDAEWNLPCRFEAYAWPSRPGEKPMLVEEYTYANLKLNVGLTDADFDVRNPQYRF